MTSTSILAYYIKYTVDGKKYRLLTTNILERNKTIFDCLNADNAQVHIVQWKYLTTEENFKRDLQHLINNMDLREIVK